jgi:hypothetical protein
MPSLRVVEVGFVQFHAAFPRAQDARVAAMRGQARDASMKRIDVSAILEVGGSISRHRALTGLVLAQRSMKFGEESACRNFKGFQRVNHCSLMWTLLSPSVRADVAEIMPLAARKSGGILRPLRDEGRT